MSDEYDFLFEEEEEEEIYTAPKKSSVFDLYNSITFDKNVDDIKWNKNDLFFLLKLMTYNNKLLVTANETILLAEDMFDNCDPIVIVKMLECSIPKGKYYTKYKKKKLDKRYFDVLDNMVIFFKVNRDIAIEYMDLISAQGEEVFDKFYNFFKEE